MSPITYEDFAKVAMCVGTILQVELNEKANKPAYVLTIDFGDEGIKTSSAQLTRNYQINDLVGKQIIAVMNFSPKRIAGIKSEVLVLGALSAEKNVVLLHPSLSVENGSIIA